MYINAQLTSIPAQTMYKTPLIPMFLALIYAHNNVSAAPLFLYIYSNNFGRNRV